MQQPKVIICSPLHFELYLSFAESKMQHKNIDVTVSKLQCRVACREAASRASPKNSRNDDFQSDSRRTLSQPLNSRELIILWYFIYGISFKCIADNLDFTMVSFSLAYFLECGPWHDSLVWPLGWKMQYAHNLCNTEMNKDSPFHITCYMAQLGSFHGHAFLFNTLN